MLYERGREVQWGDAGRRRGRGEVARSNKASSNAKVITPKVGPHGVPA